MATDPDLLTSGTGGPASAAESQTGIAFATGYADAVPELSIPWTPAPFAAPRLLVLQEVLAEQLGLDPCYLRSTAGVALLSGQAPAGVRTTAQVYAGHQFGGYSPRLGDGRALLLGEIVDPRGARWDLHLKGSGRTPFARGGDGKAVVGPMLREFVISEAMYHLGIPTTRSLSVVATGESVLREEGPLPGAVLARVAASHLRVGTFQYAAATGDVELVRRLADYAIARHYPDAVDDENPYLGLFARVVRAQADLIVDWMLVGFIHGVMNTDNTTISGQTIDYGPCAFMDAFDPVTVFSSIDHQGRYALVNQPPIAQWNLARLAETLLPLFDADSDRAVEQATDVLNEFASRYADGWSAGMAAKLGLSAPAPSLVNALLTLMTEQRVDWTMFFRALAAGRAEQLFGDPAPFRQWLTERDDLLSADPDREERMNRVNPVYIPRNHLVQSALDAANAGDLEPVERLLDVLQHPFEERPGLAEFALPAPEGGPDFVTYCGT